LSDSASESPSLVEDLCRQFAESIPRRLPEPQSGEPLARLLAELLQAEVDEESARELVERVRVRSAPDDLDDFARLKVRLARLVEREIACAGPIRPSNSQRVVAFVGPTGVGKTTTIAKLAADFHLRENKRVGLVTVDTYRVAAVDQLRTYAEIIDLPMEVVANGRDMRTALAKLSDMDLILMDTAGHSPADEGKLQELRNMLQDSQAHEVHLVVSGAASISSLEFAISRFTAVGATRLVVTKLDETTGWGHVWPILRGGKLPLSYMTHGQKVPDDIAPADARQLARQLLRMDGGR
jgi:flagellar biosynthesis protein FlhF